MDVQARKPQAPPTGERKPRVSIAIPVYNASGTIEHALASALRQTAEDFEVVIVDNASTDDTVDIIRGFRDPRIRLYRNSSNIGGHRNANRAAQMTQGELIKFLHADDELYPTCLERMVEVMDRSDRVGLVFARRKIEIADEDNPDFRRFRANFSDAARKFGPIGEVNDGREMLRWWLRSGFPENWLGEPSSVMMRRQALAQMGLFNTRIRMIMDVEMWARAMASFDVGFIDEELSVFRFHDASMTRSQGVDSRWLDALWVLEGLIAAGVDGQFPELRARLRRERRSAVKTALEIVAREPKLVGRCLRDASAYARFAASRELGRCPRLHETLPAAPISYSI